jgi:putative transposase
MSNYRRVRVPGGTYFFTVNLLERRRRLLVDRIDDLHVQRRPPPIAIPEESPDDQTCNDQSDGD